MEKVPISKLVYMENWGRGRFCIEKLCQRNNISIHAVCTQYFASSRDPYFNSVHNYAVERNIPILNIANKNSLEVSSLILEYLKQTGDEDLVGISVAFNKIFKRELLSRLKIINLHPSLLPKYRGASPEMWSLKNKEKYIGITLHWVNEGIDTGNILYQDKFEIDYDMSLIVFIDWLNAQSAKVLDDYFEMNLPFDSPGKVQEQLTLYSDKIHTEEHWYNKKLHEISDLLNKAQVGKVNENPF